GGRLRGRGLACCLEQRNQDDERWHPLLVRAGVSNVTPVADVGYWSPSARYGKTGPPDEEVHVPAAVAARAAAHAGRSRFDSAGCGCPQAIPPDGSRSRGGAATERACRAAREAARAVR